MDLAQARRYGVAYVPRGGIEDGWDDDIREFVARVEEAMFAPPSVHHILSAFDTGSTVWRKDHVLQFAICAPMDNLLLRCPVITNSDHGVELMDVFMNILHSSHSGSIDVDHFVCALIPFLVQELGNRDVPFLSILMVLLCTTEVEHCRPMLHDTVLFHALSKRLVTEPWMIPHVSGFVSKAECLHMFAVIHDVVRVCIQHVICDRSGIGDDTVRFLCGCLIKDSVYGTWFMDSWIQLWRTGWPVSLGQLVACLTAPPSVEFIVKLEKQRRLGHLLRCCADHADSDLSWRAVREHIRCAWPERLCAAFNTAPDQTATCSATCPITLSEMVHPVVASDGNTYERDAIMEHLLRNGPISPLTRQRITYHLVDNRAVLHN